MQCGVMNALFFSAGTQIPSFRAPFPWSDPNHSAGSASHSSAAGGIPESSNTSSGRLQGEASERGAEEERAGPAEDKRISEPEGMTKLDSAISGLSISQPFPRGPVFQALGRIRSTINTYVRQCEEFDWPRRAKLATLMALRQRLLNNERHIRGVVDPDVELAFDALTDRINALTQVIKNMKKWSDSSDLDVLISSGELLAQIEASVEAISGRKLAPDLRLLCLFAGLHKAMKNNKSLATALLEIDFAEWGLWRKAAIEYQAPVKQVKSEGDSEQGSRSGITGVKEEESEVESGEAGDDGSRTRAKAKAREKRKVYRKNAITCSLDIIDRFQMKSPLPTQVGFIFAEVLKQYFRQLPPLVGMPDLATRVVKDLSDLERAWSQQPELGSTSTFHSLTCALRDIFSVAGPHGTQARPSDVRAARRLVYGQAKENTPLGTLAKGAILFKNCGPVMDASKAYALSGMEDSSPSSVFKAGFT